MLSLTMVTILQPDHKENMYILQLVGKWLMAADAISVGKDANFTQAYRLVSYPTGNHRSLGKNVHSLNSWRIWCCTRRFLVNALVASRLPVVAKQHGVISEFQSLSGCKTVYSKPQIGNEEHCPAKLKLCLTIALLHFKRFSFYFVC